MPGLSDILALRADQRYQDAGGGNLQRRRQMAEEERKKNALLEILNNQTVAQNNANLRGTQLQNTQLAQQMARAGRPQPIDPYKAAQIEKIKFEIEQARNKPKESPFNRIPEEARRLLPPEAWTNPDSIPHNEQVRLATEAVGKWKSQPKEVSFQERKFNQEQADKAKTEEQSAADSRAVLEDAYRISESLLTPERDGAVRAAVGTIDSMFPTFQPDVKDVENEVETLKKILAKDNLGLLSGVMSDSDIKFITDIASGELQIDGSEEKFFKVLRKIKTNLGAKLGIDGNELFNEADSIING